MEMETFKVEAISFIIYGQREQNTDILNLSSDTTSKRGNDFQLFFQFEHRKEYQVMPMYKIQYLYQYSKLIKW